MQKTLRIILFILIIVGIVLLCTQKTWMPKLVDKILSAENNTEPTKPTETSSIKGCYVATLLKDVYTLTILSQQGETFEGTLKFKNFEKDSSSGTFKGTYKNGILLGDYSFDSEGMHSVMQVIFKKSGDNFVRGYGNVDASGTRFTDLNSITYDTQQTFKPTPNCNNS